MTATSEVSPGKVSFTAAARILADRDPVIAGLLAQTGPPRLSRPSESHFATLVRAVVYQQLAGRAAAAIHGRLITALGGDVQPEALIVLRRMGLRRAWAPIYSTFRPLPECTRTRGQRTGAIEPRISSSVGSHPSVLRE